MRAVHLAFSLVVGASFQSLFGTDVNWSSLLFQNNTESSGTSLTSEWEFHLGYFESGYIPTAGNTDSWADNWTSVDSVRYFELGSRFSATYSSDGSATGQRGYIWGLNRSSPTNEWILVSDPSWDFPAVGGGVVFSALDWGVEDASLVVVGTVNANDIHMETAAVIGNPPFLSYEDWQQLHFSEAQNAAGLVVGEEEDPDGDGAPNLLEYGLGTSPVTAGSFPSLEQAFDINGLHLITVRFARQVDVTLLPQVSGDLSIWDSGESSLTILEFSDSTLIFRDDSVASPRFARVQVLPL